MATCRAIRVTQVNENSGYPFPMETTTPSLAWETSTALMSDVISNLMKIKTDTAV
jgi:hypothetical protein